eukprot:TRINITY_DN446_c1_g3_i1.p1 TRINITY_DN446_c1_g3~~TRINITY_DN446_c1_g3_i1.p1  ORF type:complete len:349 (-),score=8.51 TRINITY_DN446_c1_g3_i1:156-1202(-)
MQQNQQSDINFCAPEFGDVFKRILKYQKKDGYHQLRSLNKAFLAQFDETIDTAVVRITHLRSLVESKFAEKIRLLTVQIPRGQEQLDGLHLISPNYLRNILKVNIVLIDNPDNFISDMTLFEPLFLQGVNNMLPDNFEPLFLQGVNNMLPDNWISDKRLTLSEPLILRGVNMVCDSDCYFSIRGEFDITITDSNFCNVQLNLVRSNNIFIKNTSFQGDRGLTCKHALNTIKIEQVEFLNSSFYGLDIFYCNDINIAGLRTQNCTYGVTFVNVNGFNLTDGNIKNSNDKGISFLHCTNAKMYNCIVSGSKNIGIQVINSTVRYSGVQVEINGNDSQDVFVEDGEFTEIQ